MMLNYKNGPPKYQCLHFYNMNIVHAIEYHPYLLICACRGGEVFKMHAVHVERHVEIAPSADFRPGRPFPSSTMKSCAFGNNCWAVMDSE